MHTSLPTWRPMARYQGRFRCYHLRSCMQDHSMACGLSDQKITTVIFTENSGRFQTNFRQKPSKSTDLIGIDCARWGSLLKWLWRRPADGSKRGVVKLI